jgi:hypothetical protein
MTAFPDLKENQYRGGTQEMAGCGETGSQCSEGILGR